MAIVFLSYSRRSGPVVKSLIEDIEALGHDVWYDQELSGGQAWWDEILERIRGCAIFVLVLDPHVLESTACMREFAYATVLGVPVLPVQVSPEVSTTLLPPALSHLQIVRFVEPDRESAIRLARALANQPRRGPLPDPLPPPPQIPITYLGGLAEQVAADRDLTYQEQMSLFIELRREFHNHRNADDARVLLLRLKDRRDLYAAVEKEIDHALADARQVEPAGALGEREQALADGRQAEEANFLRELEQALADARRAEQIDAPERHSNPAWYVPPQSAQQEPKPENDFTIPTATGARGSYLRARLAASLLFALLGGVLGFWAMSTWEPLYREQSLTEEYFFLMLPIVAFAIAGGLSRFDWRHVILWLLCAAVGFVVVASVNPMLSSPADDPAWGFVFGASGGAVTGALLWYAGALISCAAER